METTFKRGDRVRLKAWVAPSGPHYKYFNHNSVGIVGEQAAMTRIIISGKEHTVVRTAFPKKYARRNRYPYAAVPTEDLELMPERQVHVIKDGKVYEMRKSEPTKLPCIKCSLSEFGKTCPKTCQIHYNYQEVTSGKLVS